jgi:hypothetical protein
MSKFLLIFLLNLNFLPAHKNRYLDGMDDRQETRHGHPSFNSYINLEELIRLPSPHRINFSVRPSARPLCMKTRRIFT